MPVLTEEIRNRIRAEFPKYPDKRAVTLNALHMVHDANREVSTEAIREIAELLELHPSEVLDTMSFYNFFHEADNPLGRSGCGFAGVFPACCAAGRSCFSRSVPAVECECWRNDFGRSA